MQGREIFPIVDGPQTLGWSIPIEPFMTVGQPGAVGKGTVWEVLIALTSGHFFHPMGPEIASTKVKM